MKNSFTRMDQGTFLLMLRFKVACMNVYQWHHDSGDSDVVFWKPPPLRLRVEIHDGGDGDGDGDGDSDSDGDGDGDGDGEEEARGGILFLLNAAECPDSDSESL